MDIVFHTCEWFYCISAQNLDFRGVELGKVRLFWKLIRSRIWFDSFHTIVKLQFESLFQVVKLENGDIWRWSVVYPTESVDF